VDNVMLGVRAATKRGGREKQQGIITEPAFPKPGTGEHGTAMGGGRSQWQGGIPENDVKREAGAGPEEGKANSQTRRDE